MENSTVFLTRKIQLIADLPTQEERKEVVSTLYKWQNRCFIAANMIVSHLYVQEMVKDFFYFSEGIKYKLADENKDDAGILKWSRSTIIYRVLSKRFKDEIPMYILSSLINTLYLSFKKDCVKYWKGELSLKIFKRDIAIPFNIARISKFSYDKDKKYIYFKLYKIPFKTYLGRDYIDNYKLLEQIVSKEIRICRSHIKLEKNKIFWVFTVEIEKEKNQLQPDIIAEVSLSLEYPLVVKIGRSQLTIGSKEEFLYRRLAIQASRKRILEGVPFCKGGKGKARKLKIAKKLKNTESKYIHHRLHVYSRMLIDFCVEKKAGTIVIVDQEEKIQIAKEERFVLRNWSYYELIHKIKYKADKAGIELITA
ncbi:hypothetical protein [Empedobacter sp. UBA1574]|uniref:hypothetical protein n=1 Tax=Empedobacter sp. UBA1574 TaxID=1946429 RepID=UPI0025C07CD5|nr:hypothetical protein [Empedobacter sp. UBA1574]